MLCHCLRFKAPDDVSNRSVPVLVGCSVLTGFLCAVALIGTAGGVKATTEMKEMGEQTGSRDEEEVPLGAKYESSDSTVMGGVM